jgi:undecaprenyl-diphosphatase
MDEALFRWINGWPEWMTPAMRFLSEATKQSEVRVALAALIVAMLIRGHRTRVAIVLALIAFLLANEACDVLKRAFPVPRPSNVLDGVELRVGRLTSMGTASSHAANMAAVAAVLTAKLKWWGAPWIALALLVGLSRVFVGVHYPSQVLFGWLVGLFAAFLSVATYGAWTRLRQRPVDHDEQ